ncbi:forespore regulator of the sigma-K checkpoint [Paenibacillus sp. DS2015]|uniref:BofC C-terminal domain-containing protein n=1 Tax=Paenibacillus sp. DS2015 TaxID=3373917 RepID=UPI003D1F0C7D
MKRHWKQWKRRIGAVVTCALVIVLIWWGNHLPNRIESLLSFKPQLAVETLRNLQSTSSEEEYLDEVDLRRKLRSNNEIHEVTLLKQYICGQEKQSLGKMKSNEIGLLLDNHSTWKADINDNGEVLFIESISDLSPECKQKAYIGMDIDGNLTMYEDSPKKEKVLKTFFQLDINSMESSLPDGVLEQLQQGIRIKDVDEYNSVISTFSDYAREHSENVMKRTK